jgi:hypothetical protein
VYYSQKIAATLPPFKVPSTTEHSTVLANQAQHSISKLSAGQYSKPSRVQYQQTERSAVSAN